MKRIFIIFLLGSNVFCQTKKDIIIPAVFYGVTAGMSDALRIQENQMQNSGLIKQANEINRDWHKIKFANQVGGIVLGIQIYRTKHVFKATLLSGAVYWIVHDIAYNVIRNRSLFYVSKTSGSFMEKLFYCKPIILAISIKL